MADFSPHQQKIIKRYYDNLDTLSLQRLAELVGELYLTQGKKRQRVWTNLKSTMEKLGVPQSRIDHLAQQDNPGLVAEMLDFYDALRRQGTAGHRDRDPRCGWQAAAAAPGRRDRDALRLEHGGILESAGRNRRNVAR